MAKKKPVLPCNNHAGVTKSMMKIWILNKSKTPGNLKLVGDENVNV